MPRHPGIIKYGDHKIYGAIHFVCPVFEGEQNGSYNFLHNQKQVLVYKHYSEAVSKAVDKSRQSKRTLFLIDDGTSELMQNNDKTFILLISTTRHYAGLTLWANVHSCKKILSPVCRQNLDFLFLYHTPNKISSYSWARKGSTGFGRCGRRS